MTARLFLSKLDLRRFRSHQAFSRDFHGRPVAIYGPNGAGKTNILEAISLLTPGRGLRGAKADEMAGRPEPIGWAVRATVESPEGAREISVSVDLRGAARRQITLDEAPATQTDLGGVLRALWLTPAMDRLWIEGAGERRRFLDRTTLAFDPGHAERSAAYERAMRERNRLLKDGVSDPAWLDALEAQMAERGLEIASARVDALDRLARAQATAETVFPRAEVSIEEEEPVAGVAGVEAYRERLAAGRRRDAAAGRALFGPHRSDLQAIYAAKNMEARHCSTGEQKALLISLVLATARAIDAMAGAPPVMLLDEIAAHLDDGRRAALYDELTAIGAQAWMTGTGPELFEALGERAERIELGG